MSLPCPRQLEATLPEELLATPHWLPWVGRPRGNGGTGKVPRCPELAVCGPQTGAGADCPGATRSRWPTSTRRVVSVWC